MSYHLGVLHHTKSNQNIESICMDEQGTAISFLSRVQWSHLGSQAMSSGSDAQNRSDRPNETGLRVYLGSAFLLFSLLILKAGSPDLLLISFPAHVR